MPTPLVECVPNFSEGRRPEVINAIVGAIQTADVRLLDVSSDSDHNRTVVTFVGTPEAVEAAAFAGIKTAASLIDLNVHRGEHPRMGATDVVPFIPIRDVTMDTCIAIAKRLGKRVADELNIPVYLYESAATRPDRENLENIRRGEYEGIKQAIKTDPARTPDFGPSELGTAGATVIGARPPLIAFNVYLTTDNVEIAKKIAKAMRMSTGGFRFVKALGLLVDGKAQVSMNLTNFEKTPIYRVVEAIRREAERYGVGILYTELVGLTPENALIDSARWYLQLDLFDTTQILEWKLQETATTPSPSAEIVPDARGEAFVTAVAAGTAAPGGGAVAALAGSLAAALAEMVARLTIGKKKYADVETEMLTVADAAQALRRQLLDAVEEDSAAYGAVMAAYKLDTIHPKRDQSIQTALIGAAEVPLMVIRLSSEAIKLARIVVEKGNLNAASDAAVAALMANAAIEGAALNVLTNVKSLTNRSEASRLREGAVTLREAARSLSAEIVHIAESRAGLG
ncbi:MAG: glutamate formimidoyltransferase [Anaerolineae bacterium]|nr:glutamate formimidoyltransferase [Anaerolineae bacterium]